MTIYPGGLRRRRLGHYRNSHGELWVNVSATHLVLADFVNLDRGPYPALAAVYPAIRWLPRALRPLGAPLARVRRLPLTPRSSRLPDPPGGVRRVPGADRAAVLRRMWEARREAVVADHRLRAPLPFDAGAVDHVLCSHLLQLLPPRAVGGVLADYARVLRPGGTLHVILPDLRFAVERYVRGDIDADELMAWQRLSDPADGLARAGFPGPSRGNRPHRWMYDAHTAERRLVGAGLKIADVVTPSSWVRADEPGSLHIVAVRP